MKKRIITWIILAVMLVAVIPTAWAAPAGPVEEYTVEREGNVITVTPPAGYAEKGYYKLFWKNEATGEIQSDVFPVDTASYRIDAEEGAEYTFQLHYARKKGNLPAGWKGAAPSPTPSGPSVWKVLWIDAPVIDFRGYTTRMTEANFKSSGEIAQAFEAFAEELTLGRVDIQITRMTLDTPITELEYYPDNGYYVDPDNCDMKHYAMRKYDSVFVIGRFEHILRHFDGITVQVDNPKETPGYSFVPIFGDDLLSLSTVEYGRDVCVHEWIHQLVFLYETYHLDVPDPDEPEKYGYLPYEENGGLDHGLFRDILTMTAVSEDGRYIGVPADAWQYKPTKYAQLNLSSLQQEKAPAAPATPAPEAEPAAVTALADVNPEVFGTLDEVNGIYDNPYMGLTLNLAGWNTYTPGNMPYRTSSIEPAEDDPDFMKNNDTIPVLIAADADEPVSVTLAAESSPVPFIRENGEDAYFQLLQKNYERWAVQYQCVEYSIGRVERSVDGRTLPGIRFDYISGGVSSGDEILIWLEDDHMGIINISNFMFDNVQDTLDLISWME